MKSDWSVTIMTERNLKPYELEVVAAGLTEDEADAFASELASRAQDMCDSDEWKQEDE